MCPDRRTSHREECDRITDPIGHAGRLFEVTLMDVPRERVLEISLRMNHRPPAGEGLT
jgi:hypothetical protein